MKCFIIVFKTFSQMQNNLFNIYNNIHIFNSKIFFNIFTEFLLSNKSNDKIINNINFYISILQIIKFL